MTGARVEGLRGIVFDKDGTLFDFQSSWARWTGRLISDLAQGDGARRAALADAVDFDLSTGLLAPRSVIVAHTEREAAEALLAAMPPGTPLSAVLDRMRAMAGDVDNMPVVPLDPLFARLRADGLALGLATNDSEEAALLHLEDAGVLGHFAFVAGYDSGHGAKPGPGQLLAFAAALDLAPGACLMVGDSRHDLVAGRAAGMRTAAVLTGLVAAEELAPLADAVLPDIGSLPDWISGATNP